MSRVQEVPGLCFSGLFAFIPEPLEEGGVVSEFGLSYTGGRPEGSLVSVPQ